MRKTEPPPYLKTNSAEEAKLHNIVDMALGFSSMIRLLQEGSKQKLKVAALKILGEVFETEKEAQFNEIHEVFCRWGVKNIMLAEKRRGGRLIKKSAPVSYGQVAKILDVLLAVVVYYSHLPDCDRARVISSWIHAAVDNKMMQYLKSFYPAGLHPWPKTIEQVQHKDYLAIQKLVKIFIAEEWGGDITPTQFDDIYWEALNRQ